MILTTYIYQYQEHATAVNGEAWLVESLTPRLSVLYVGALCIQETFGVGALGAVGWGDSDVSKTDALELARRRYVW